MTPHIEAEKGDIAKIVLMPGDPKRSELIARKYLESPRLVNAVRGMNAYTGFYKGKRVTIFPSGMGIPSMGIYSYELFKFYNVDKIIRIGTVGGYLENEKVFDIVLAKNSISKSNYALDLANDETHMAQGSEELNSRILLEAEREGINVRVGNIYSTETFYDGGKNLNMMKNDFKCIGTEMESYALFSNAKYLGKDAACLLTISDNLVTHEEIDSKAREQSLDKMIVLALNSIL